MDRHDAKKRPSSTDPSSTEEADLISAKKPYYQQSARNGGVMMEVASDPDDACLTPLDDCLRYLQRNPAMREIIGALIRQEEEEKGRNEVKKQRAKKTPKENSTIQQWMNQFQAPGCKWNDDLIANDYASCLSELREDDGSKQLEDNVPDPLPEACSTAALRAITVHFDNSCTVVCPVVKGFTMTYADGVEIQSAGSHLFGGTGKVHLQLEPNEHIVDVQETYCNSSTKEWLWKIQFETTDDRYLEAIMDEDTDRFYPGSTKSLKSGHALRGLNWDPDRMSIVSYDTVPMDDLSDVSAKSSKSIPTLQHLVHESIMSTFKEKAQSAEHNAKVAQHALAKTAEQSRLSSYEKHRIELQGSSEANFYRLLAFSLVPKAKEMLRVRAQRLLDSAKSEASNIISLANGDRAIVRRECCKEHLSIFKEQRAFLDSCADTSNIQTSSGEQETFCLCFTPECRKVFDYRKVPWHKRCTEPKCTTDFPNCGCSVTSCGVCHQILCSLHLPSHYKDCATTAPRYCGYLAADGRLHPEFCKELLVGDQVQKPCFCCNIKCCLACSYSCNGCDKVWCDSCYKIRDSLKAIFWCCDGAILGNATLRRL